LLAIVGPMSVRWYHSRELSVWLSGVCLAEWRDRQTADARFTVSAACQHLIKTLETGGEAGAAELLRRLGMSSSPARELAYRVPTSKLCERTTQQAGEARSYNGRGRVAAAGGVGGAAGVGGEALRQDFGG